MGPDSHVPTTVDVEPQIESSPIGAILYQVMYISIPQSVTITPQSPASSLVESCATHHFLLPFLSYNPFSHPQFVFLHSPLDYPFKEQ